MYRLETGECHLRINLSSKKNYSMTFTIRPLGIYAITRILPGSAFHSLSYCSDSVAERETMNPTWLESMSLVLEDKLEDWRIVLPPVVHKNIKWSVRTNLWKDGTVVQTEQSKSHNKLPAKEFEDTSGLFIVCVYLCVYVYCVCLFMCVCLLCVFIYVCVFICVCVCLLCVCVILDFAAWYLNSAQILDHILKDVTKEMKENCKIRGVPFPWNTKIEEYQQTLSLITSYCLVGSQSLTERKNSTLIDNWIYNAMSFLRLPANDDENYMGQLFENVIRASVCGYLVIPTFLSNSLCVKTTWHLQKMYENKKILQQYNGNFEEDVIAQIFAKYEKQAKIALM